VKRSADDNLFWSAGGWAAGRRGGERKKNCYEYGPKGVGEQKLYICMCVCVCVRARLAGATAAVVDDPL